MQASCNNGGRAVRGTACTCWQHAMQAPTANKRGLSASAAPLSKPARAELSLVEPLKLPRSWLQNVPLLSAANGDDGTALQQKCHTVLEQSQHRIRVRKPQAWVPCVTHMGAVCNQNDRTKDTDCTLVAQRSHRCWQLVVVVGSVHLQVAAPCAPPSNTGPYNNGQQGNDSKHTNHYAGDCTTRNAAAATPVTAWLSCMNAVRRPTNTVWQLSSFQSVQPPLLLAAHAHSMELSSIPGVNALGVEEKPAALLTGAAVAPSVLERQVPQPRSAARAACAEFPVCRSPLLANLTSLSP